MTRREIFLALWFGVCVVELGSAAEPVSVVVTARPPQVIDTDVLYRNRVRPRDATHVLRLTFAYFPAAGWNPPALVGAADAAAEILAQCSVRIATLELVALEGERRIQDFSTPVSRELARRVPLARPAVYFVADTQQRPAFDAEAIGRSNSRTRPELANTVWVTRGTRDLGISLAHELVHVLVDSGEHSRASGNLMRENTAPQHTTLDPEQCDRLRAVGTAHGLLEQEARAR